MLLQERRRGGFKWEVGGCSPIKGRCGRGTSCVMHTLAGVLRDPGRLYPESVITNYQEKALRRSLSLLLLAAAKAPHARRRRLHHISAATPPPPPSSTPSSQSSSLYLLQLYSAISFLTFTSWRQKENNGSIIRLFPANFFFCR